ncbi:hypothetical protein [Bacillus cereus]|uniref:hypothetical protein n=1 Tax=Bacillus cereus TaxID=1396 RepID=UPI002D789BFC|nr:hypothetical protein [Bacillus cereus]
MFLISIHVNIGDGKGFETFRFIKTDNENVKMHTIINRNIIWEIIVYEIIYREMKAAMPASLLEAGFCDSSINKKLKGSVYKQTFSSQVAQAILDIFSDYKDAESKTFKVDDNVTVRSTATQYVTGEKIMEFVKGSKYLWR